MIVRPAVIVRESGRSSIAETAVLEPIAAAYWITRVMTSAMRGDAASHESGRSCGWKPTSLMTYEPPPPTAPAQASATPGGLIMQPLGQGVAEATWPRSQS